MKQASVDTGHLEMKDGNAVAPSAETEGASRGLALADREPASEDYYPSHEALCDLVSLQSEHWALNGGGPGWQTRWDAALRRAEDIVRVEP